MVSFAFLNSDVSVKLGNSGFTQSLFHIHLFDIVKFYANVLPSNIISRTDVCALIYKSEMLCRPRSLPKLQRKLKKKSHSWHFLDIVCVTPTSWEKQNFSPDPLVAAQKCSKAVPSLKGRKRPPSLPVEEHLCREEYCASEIILEGDKASSLMQRSAESLK